MSWQDTLPEPAGRLGPLAILRLILRFAILGSILLVLVAVMLLARLVERPLVGARRPVSSWCPRLLCRCGFAVMGIGLSVQGRPMREAGAVVANHSSWFDIFALNACTRVFFVAKSEVARWPGIGQLARAAGTIFVKRDKREARAQVLLFRERLAAGHRLLFFPEGTSTDGRRVLPFKTTLFAAFFTPELRPLMSVQPVSVIYHAPKGAEPRFYGWWGDMSFGTHFLRIMAAWPQGRVELIYHPPVRVADFVDRKALAAHCEAAVRGGLMTGLGLSAEEAGAGPA